MLHLAIASVEDNISTFKFPYLDVAVISKTSDEPASDIYMPSSTSLCWISSMLRLFCERAIWITARNDLWNVEFSLKLVVLEPASEGGGFHLLGV